MKIVDWILVGVVVASIGFVAFKFVNRSQQPVRTEIQTPTNALLQKSSNQPNQLNKEDAIDSAFGKFKALSDAQWRKSLEENVLTTNLTSESPGCAVNPQIQQTINLNSEALAKSISEGRANVLLGFRTRACFRQKSKVEIVYFPRELNSVVLTRVKTAQIREILSLPTDIDAGKFKKFLSTIGLTPEDYELILAGRYLAGSTAPEYVLQVELDESRPNKDLPPRGYPTTLVLSRSEAEAAADSQKAIIVDVRSKEEFSSGSAKGAIHIPLIIPPGTSPTFRDDIRKSHVNKADFNVAAVLSARREGRIIIVGRDAKDVRPLYALEILYQNGTRSMGWIYDGIQK